MLNEPASAPEEGSASGSPLDGLRARVRALGFEGVGDASGLPALRVGRDASLQALERLRDDPGLAMHRLVDLTVVDAGSGADGASGGLEVVYALHSPAQGFRMRVHVTLDEADPEVDSVAALWPAADWLEREAFDLFGVRFRGHPDLRRILQAPDAEGAPLRKHGVPGSATAERDPDDVDAGEGA